MEEEESVDDMLDRILSEGILAASGYEGLREAVLAPVSACGGAALSSGALTGEERAAFLRAMKDWTC